MTNIKFENFERECLDEIFDEVAPFSQMEKNEKYFLNGAVRYLKPKNILEVGIAYGGGSSIILNAIKDIEDAHLTSVDYCEKCYDKSIDKTSGFIVEEKFSHLKDKWTRYLGGDVSKFIERIRGGYDLLVLDTAHIHPWETLNFLCVLPFMKKDSWVVLHDISVQLYKYREEDLACRYLFGHVVSDEKLTPAPDFDPYFSNIGAFKITDDTRKYIGNLFESLLIPWQALPFFYDKIYFPYATPMLEEDLNDIRKIISKYYPEHKEFFEHAIEAQKTIIKHKIEQRTGLKAAIKRNFPYLTRPLRSIHVALDNLMRR